MILWPRNLCVHSWRVISKINKLHKSAIFIGKCLASLLLRKSLKCSQQTHYVCLLFIKTNLPPSHPIIINWGNKKHQTEALLLKHTQNNECFFYHFYHIFELESLLKINNVFRSGQIGGTRFLLPLSVSVNTHEKETRPGFFFTWSGVKIYMRGQEVKSNVPQKLVLASHNDCYFMYVT